jgi:hypothetical protein
LTERITIIAGSEFVIGDHVDEGRGHRDLAGDRLAHESPQQQERPGYAARRRRLIGEQLDQTERDNGGERPSVSGAAEGLVPDRGRADLGPACARMARNSHCGRALRRIESNSWKSAKWSTTVTTAARIKPPASQPAFHARRAAPLLSGDAAASAIGRAEGLAV